MLRINKVSEYGVLALGFISRKAEPQSATDVSLGLHVPYEITAKTLQKLKEAGWLQSTKGINGGYTLTRSLSSISFGQVIDAFEGPVALVECEGVSGHKECQREMNCEIKFGIKKINQKMRDLLDSVTLDELISMENVTK